MTPRARFLHHQARLSVCGKTHTTSVSRELAAHVRKSAAISADALELTIVDTPPINLGSSIDGTGRLPSWKKATNQAMYTRRAIKHGKALGIQPRTLALVVKGYDDSTHGLVFFLRSNGRLLRPHPIISSPTCDRQHPPKRSVGKPADHSRDHFSNAWRHTDSKGRGRRKTSKVHFAGFPLSAGS